MTYEKRIEGRWRGVDALRHMSDAVLHVVACVVSVGCVLAAGG